MIGMAIAIGRHAAASRHGRRLRLIVLGIAIGGGIGAYIARASR
jgi:NAD/NADP transhydrogenase beta subunit